MANDKDWQMRFRSLMGKHLTDGLQIGEVRNRLQVTHSVGNITK